jgi:hypothetical protein
MTRRPRARRREVIVFTEGENTEVSYVDIVKRLQERFAIRVDDRHGHPGYLVPLAIAELRRLIRLDRAEGAPESERPQVWCFFDRDQHSDVDSLIQQAIAAGVAVAFSHPCFELWLCWHFADHGAPAGGACGGLVDRVEAHLPGYKARGKRVRLVDIEGRYAAALDRARDLGRRHERDGIDLPTKRDPSTGAHEFLEALKITY